MSKYKVYTVKDFDNAKLVTLPVQCKEDKTVPVIEGYMPFRGFKTFFRIAGKGNPDKAPIILLHGGPGGSCDTMELLDSLSLYDNRQIISYDQIGCGRSFVPGHKDWWRCETWVEELASLREYLGIEKCHLLGHSWGTMLILAYLIDKKPKGIISAVLSSGLSSASLWESEQARLIKYLSDEDQAAVAMAAKTKDYKNPDVIKANHNYSKLYSCYADDRSNWPECFLRETPGHDEVYETAWGPFEFFVSGTLGDFEYTDKLDQVNIPCFIIHGSDDECTPIVAKAMYDGIKNSSWEILQGARHRCYWDAKDKYEQSVNAWLCNND